MHKKIIMACTAIAAFAGAPTASAANLTSNGTTVGVGASITATNTGETEFKAGELTIHCGSAHMSGTVTADASGTIAAEIPSNTPVFKGTGAGEDCTSPLGSMKWMVNSSLCLHIPKGTDAGTITGCTGNVTFTLNVTGVVSCTYQTASISGTITTSAGTTTIAGAPATRDTGNTLFCPAKGELNLVFDLYTTDGTPLVFS